MISLFDGSDLFLFLLALAALAGKRRGGGGYNGGVEQGRE